MCSRVTCQTELQCYTSAAVPVSIIQLETVSGRVADHDVVTLHEQEIMLINVFISHGSDTV